MERLKTYFLLTALTLLFIFVGGALAGKTGMLIAFVIAAGMNFYTYFYSDQKVLKHYHAHPVDRHTAPDLYRIVDRLTQRAGLPMLALYILPDDQPNAFATGRDYHHAAVAVTKGLLTLLSDEEVEAVIAHELSHVKHYDMLIGTVAATIAGAISMLANFGMFSGGSSDDDRPNFIVMLALMFLAPMAAGIIQMTVSRRREFMADEGSARMTSHPEWLQSALSKLDHYARGTMIPEAQPQTAHMFIINPFTGKDVTMRQLFSTHPSTEQRIERLEALRGKGFINKEHPS